MTKVTSSEKDQEIEAKKTQEVQAKKTQEVQKAASTRALSTLEEMELVFDRMERLFGGLMPRNWLRARREWPSWQELTAPFEGWLPRVDVIEHDQEVVVRAELPGVDKKDLDVSVTEDQLTIKGSTYREEKEEKGNYYRTEISHGVFARTLSLPAEIESANAKATFKDGILKLILPKKAESSKRRAIKLE
jgi:HSP20 family protein